MDTETEEEKQFYDAHCDLARQQYEEEFELLDREYKQEADKHQPNDLSWVPRWFQKQEVKFNAVEAAAKLQYEKIVAECKTERSKLHYRWGDLFRQQSMKLLENNWRNTKSIETGMGTVGFSKTKDTVEVIEEEKALEWAKQNCPPAVKTKLSLLKTPLAEYFKVTGEVPPGCMFVRGTDEFYSRTVKIELKEGANDGRNEIRD